MELKQNHLIKKTIMEILEKRGKDKSICPSEIARLLFNANWRDYMEPVRDVANELYLLKKIDITQKNQSVGINYKGPIRLKLI